MNRTKLIIPAIALAIAGSAGATWLTSGATAAGTLPKNVTTACDHGNRLYSGKTGSALAVVPRDPTCPQPTTKKPTTTTKAPAPTTTRSQPPVTTRTTPPVATTAPATTTTQAPPPEDGGGDNG